MKKLLMGVGAIGALMVTTASSDAPAASRPAPEARSPKVAPKADDVPAPPMALLFGMGAIGLIWGRRLAANARKTRDAVRLSDAASTTNR